MEQNKNNSVLTMIVVAIIAAIVSSIGTTYVLKH